MEDELLRSQRRLAEAEAALKVERGVLEAGLRGECGSKRGRESRRS